MPLTKSSIGANLINSAKSSTLTSPKVQYMEARLAVANQFNCKLSRQTKITIALGCVSLRGYREGQSMAKFIKAVAEINNIIIQLLINEVESIKPESERKYATNAEKAVYLETVNETKKQVLKKLDKHLIDVEGL